jgi:hypothetical protein
MAGTPTYVSYIEMLKRCYDSSVIRFPRYGGRGIKVCDKWRSSFVSFLEDMGVRPTKGHSLDRLDNDSDYGPDNCRWATYEEQSQNKSTTVYITAFGETKPVSKWSDETGVPAPIIRQRIWRDKLTPEQALSPMREPGSGRHRQRLYK